MAAGVDQLDPARNIWMAAGLPERLLDDLHLSTCPDPIVHPSFKLGTVAQVSIPSLPTLSILIQYRRLLLVFLLSRRPTSIGSIPETDRPSLLILVTQYLNLVAFDALMYAKGMLINCRKRAKVITFLTTQDPVREALR